MLRVDKACAASLVIVCTASINHLLSSVRSSSIHASLACIHVAAPVRVFVGAVDVSQTCGWAGMFNRLRVRQCLQNSQAAAAVPAHMLLLLLLYTKCKRKGGTQSKRCCRSLLGTWSTVAPMPAPRSTRRDRLMTSFSVRV